VTAASRGRGRRQLALVLVALVATLAIACSDPTGSTSDLAGTTPNGVAVTDAWARTSPAGATTGAAYVRLQSPVDDALVSVSVPTAVAAGAELHQTMADGDQMSMEPITSLPLPAGQPVALEPGGTHIMLVDLAAPLTAGSSFELTLRFEHGGAEVVPIVVRD
jgi:copper(I)-binding protein